MNKISRERTGPAQVALQTPAASRSLLIVAAWVSTLLLSKLPLVIARDMLGTDIPWINAAWLGAAVLLYAVTYAWSALEPLRRYFLIMATIVLVAFWMDPIVKGTALWQNTFAGQALMVSFLGERALLVVEALIVLTVALLIGMTRQELFLTVGNLRAPVWTRNTARGKRVLSWTVFGPVMALVLGILFAAFLASQNPAGLGNLAVVLPLMPIILLSAALNAFAEETTYRAAPLATLVPAIGPIHALVLTSLWFGFGHYYGGIPSGPVGLVQTGLLALLLGKAMLDTRGLGWSWTIHLVLDTVIYIGIALSVSA